MLFFPEHRVKIQRFGYLFVTNTLIIYFYMVIVKTYKVKKIFNKFPEISELTCLHTGFRLILTSMTLNDLEQRNSPYFAFFTKFDCFAAQLHHSI